LFKASNSQEVCLFSENVQNKYLLQCISLTYKREKDWGASTYCFTMKAYHLMWRNFALIDVGIGAFQTRPLFAVAKQFKTRLSQIPV